MVLKKSCCSCAQLLVKPTAPLIVSVRAFRPAWHRPFFWPKKFEDVEFPPDGNRLPIYHKDPYGNSPLMPPLEPKRIIEMRGPELIHTQLQHKQFGIQALTGGRLSFGHFNMMRVAFNHTLDLKNMFAIYRVEAPWKVLTQKGVGHTMGGGRGSVRGFVTPVRAGRIIVEVGGRMEYFEVEHILQQVAEKLPFPARAVTQEMLEKEAAEEKEVKAKNINPISFEYAVKRNSLGISRHLSPYDYIWYNKYR